MHSSYLKESLNADISVFYNVRKIQFKASKYSVSFNASVYDKRCTEAANITIQRHLFVVVESEEIFLFAVIFS